MRILESKNFRGFLHRTAGAFFLCALLGLLLVIPSVSSDTDAAASAKPAESVNIPLYSDWRGGSLDDSSDLLLDELLADDDGGVALPAEDFNVGSFSLHRPQSELFINGLIGELYGLSAGAALGSDDIEHYLQARARARLTGEAVADFKTWLSGRGEGITDRIFLTSADYLTNYLTAAATDGAHGLRFVRTVEWDYQSSLGDRRWQTGLSALGALRESADDVIAWQLRGYAAEDSGAGANAGLIYRRASGAADGALLGVNVFLDYEKHGDFDEDFLRWSLGGEYRNAYLDVYLNRYFPITDGVRQGNGNYVYTQGGQEAYLNVKAPDFGFGRVSGGLTYYLWEGEYGDADDKGFRYHIGFAPQRGNLRLELELDSPDGGSTDWGGRVSYRHIIGGADKGNASASSDAAFDARAHFFDVVRREYAQRIRESGEGRRVAVARLTDASQNNAELAFLDTSAAPAAPTEVTVVTLSVANGVGGRHTIDLSRTVSITVEAASTLELTASNWLVTVFAESAVRLQEAGSELSVSSGQISFQRSGDGLNSFNVAGTRIALLGTRGTTGIEEGATHNSFMHLVEGTIALTITEDNQIDLEIVELEAVAMVTDARGSNADEPVMRMVGCGTPQQRENHRILQSDFAGCVDDVRISGLGDGEQVTLQTQGVTLTLRGNADSEIAVLDGDGTPSSNTWGSYPFHPHGASLTSPATDDINLSHGAGTKESMLEVAAATTLAFSYVDEEAAAETPEAVAIYVAVIGDGTASRNVSDVGDDTAVVGCDVASSEMLSATEGLANVIAICGDVAFEDSGGPVTEANIVARIGTERSYDVQVSGAGGNYVFAFVAADDVDSAVVDTGSTLSLEAATATIATLQFSPDRRIDTRTYYLRAAPLPAFADYAESAVLPIVANAQYEKFELVRDGELVTTVVTEVEWNNIIYIGFEVNGGSDVSYKPLLGLGGACERNGCSSDLTEQAARAKHFTVTDQNDGEIRVATTLALGSPSAETPGGIPVSWLARTGKDPILGNFPLTVTLTVEAVDSPDATDERLNATVTAEFKVLVRNPSGDVTTSLNYRSQMRDPKNKDFVVVGRTEGITIATFSDTGNSPEGPDNNGISVAGLFKGLGGVPPGTYEYELVDNPPHFELVTMGSKGISAVVRLLDADNLSTGAHSVTVRVNDNHSLTEPIDRVLSVSIITPLARAKPDDFGFEVNRLVVDADETITLITVVNGFGDYTYMLDVTLANAAGLFAVAASVDNAGVTVGAVSFKDDGKFRDSAKVVAVVLVQDGVEGMVRYHLTVNVLAPYAVNGSVRRQFVGEQLAVTGNPFYEFPSDTGDGFITGGVPPYTYALDADSLNVANVPIVASNDEFDDFGVVHSSGGLVPDGELTAGGLATVRIIVEDSTQDTDPSNPTGPMIAAPLATSYMITIEAIDGDIVFTPIDAGNTDNPLVFQVAYNADEMDDGVIGTVTANWEQSPGYGALAYGLRPAVSDPSLLSTLSIDSASGVLSLSDGVAKDGAFFFVEASASMEEDGYAFGDVTVPRTELLEVSLNFHAQVDFVNPQSRIEAQVVSGGGEDTVLTTFVARGGTGEYEFNIVGTPTADLVSINADSGVLSQTAAVNAAQRLPLTVRVADKNLVLGGSRNVVVEIEWTVEPPVPPIEYNASLARVLVIGGSNADVGNSDSVRNNEVWESGDGVDWTQLTPTGGKIFPARHGHAAVAHRGTVYVSGGGDGNLLSGNPPALLDDVWSSGDGSDWTLVSDGQIPPIAGHNMLARGGDLFIVGGEISGIFYSDVWRSGDGGQTWATLDIANNLQSIDAPNDNILSAINAVALFHGGSLVVINGDPAGGKVVALDESGAQPRWEELGATPVAVLGASSLGRKAAFVFNGEMHLSRGEEILSSADGKTWAVARNGGTYGTNAGTGGSQVGGHAAVSVSANRAIITGGQFGTGDRAGRTSRVWGSANGKSNWTNIKTPAEFGNLSYHAMVLVRRETFMLSGPQSSDAAPIENSFPYAAAELFRLTATGGSGARTFEIMNANPESLTLTYLVAVDSDGVVTQGAALPAGATAIEGTITFKVTDSGSPAQTDTFEAIIRLQPFVASRGEERVLLIGGQVGTRARANDIYASEDGENWVELTRAPSSEDHIFSERSGHAAVALGGTIYVSGGRINTTVFNPRNQIVTRSDEVWSSTDGAHWTLRTTHTGADADAIAANAATDMRFPARSNHKMLASGDGTNNTLFIVGGLGGTTNDKTILNDIWRSTDEGQTWAEWSFDGLNHKRKNFLAYVNGVGNLVIFGGRGDGQIRVLNTTGSYTNLGGLSQGLIAGMQPHGRNADGSKNDLTNAQRLNYVAADGATYSRGEDAVGLRILGRNNAWPFFTSGGLAQPATGSGVNASYKCFSDIGTVGHKAAFLGNKLLAIGGLDIERPVATGVYNDVWSSTNNGKDWVLSQRFPPFSPRYDQAVVTYAPLSSESVPALGSASPAKLQLKRVCGGTRTVHNDSLDAGDNLFTVTAGGGSGGDYRYSVVSVTPEDVPLRAHHLAVVEESGEQVVQIISRPAAVANTEELFVRVGVTDGADNKATVTVEVSLLPQSGLNLEGPFAPHIEAITNLDQAARLKMQGRIEQIARIRRLERTLPPDPERTLPPDPDAYIEEVGPTKVGTELFRVRTSGGSGDYGNYNYEIVGVSHTPESDDPELDASYFGITAVGSGESREAYPRSGTDNDGKNAVYPDFIAVVDKDTGVRTFIAHPNAGDPLPPDIVAFHDGFIGAFGRIEQAKLVDTRATVAVTVRVTDGAETSELEVEVELFPSPPLELLAYHVLRDNRPLPPSDVIPCPPRCGEPLPGISTLPRQSYYRYAGGAEITVTAQVGGELFRVGAGGIEKRDGGYNFSVEAVAFIKDGQTPGDDMVVNDTDLVALVAVKDKDQFIGQDNSNLRIVRLEKALPEELANANERLSIHLRVTNDDGGMADLMMTVHLRNPPPPTPGILVLGGRKAPNSETRNDDVLFLNLEGAANWEHLSESNFPARSGHAAAVLNGRVYVSGGTGDGTERLDEVLVSSNSGKTWEQLEAASVDERFPGRYHHKMIEHNGTLFVIGGISTGSTILDDVWTSTDGANWTLSEATLDNDRQSFMAFVYDKDGDGPNPARLLIAGGRNTVDMVSAGEDLAATNRDIRAFRAFNDNGANADTWDILPDSDITALPVSLYSDSELGTDRTLGGALAPHSNLGYLGAAAAVFNGSIFIYARNHIWHTDGITWTRSSTRAPYAYNYANGPEFGANTTSRRVGLQAAVRRSNAGNDLSVLLIGGIRHTNTNQVLNAGSGVWASAQGDASSWGNISRIGDGTGGGPVDGVQFRRFGHAVVAIDPQP